MLVGVDLSAETDILLRRVEAEIRRRHLTDHRMGYAWTIVPLLPILVGIALVVGFLTVVISSISSLQQAGGSVAAVAGILTLYMFGLISIYAVQIVNALAFYFLIDRRSRHFKRQQLLFDAVPKYLSASKNFASHENIGRLAELSEDSMFEEQDRPAGLWAILSIFATPIVGLIVAYDLTQDLRRHEERQSAYQQTLSSALEEAGIVHLPFASLKPHRRDPIVYIVLTVITAGLFWIYWFYTMLKDYNEHFTEQAALEDQLLASLKPAMTCAACGGSIPQNVRFCPLCGAAQSGSRDTTDRTKSDQ